MESVSADQMGTLITLSAAALGSICVIVVNCIHGSKCTKIKFCGFECDRVVTAPEPEPEPELIDQP
jgi:hypothetical protein